MAKQQISENSSSAKVRVGGPMGGGGRGMVGGEKPKNFKKSIGKLLAYLRKAAPAMIVALILAALGTVGTIIGPNQLGRISDEIQRCFVWYKEAVEAAILAGQNPASIVFPSIDLNLVINVGLILVIIYSVSAIINYIQGYVMTTVTQRLSRQLRSDLFKKFDRIPLKYFDSTNHGNVMSRVTNDVDTINQTLSQSISTLITSVITLLGVGIMMFITNYLMALAAIGATLVGFLLMSLIIKNSQKHFSAQQRELGKINGIIEETYTGHNVVKAYNGEKAAKKEFGSVNTALNASARKSQFFSGLMMPLMMFVGNFGFVMVCIVGALLLKNGSITLGAITSMVIYVRLFTQPLSQIAQGATALQSTAAASERVFEFLGEKEEENEDHKTKTLENVKGDVEFKDVKFGYNEDKTIINNFSAIAKSGQKIAIVGPTGAGKTTMVNLLMRFYEVNEGSIIIDGVPINEVKRENARAQFCMVLQDTWLFEGTIRQNLIYNNSSITEEQMIKACEIVGVDHFIKTLAHGYDTVIEEGSNLSSGQRQLLTIARAMLQDAPMLILDEATSNVDTRTEIQIQKAMDKLMKGRTSFVIAHRLSTIKNADLILVMKDGDILEQGTHAALLKKNGFYANLYNSQFE